jgi:hypothetical protein
MTARRLLKVVLVVIGVAMLAVAGVVGADWLAPDKPEDAGHLYYALLPFGAAFGITGLAL